MYGAQPGIWHHLEDPPPHPLVGVPAMRRSLVPLAVAATLLPGGPPASAAPVVVDTAYAQRDGARSATGVCVAVAAGAIAVAFVACGFEGDAPSAPTSFGTQAAAVATFRGPIGEQPRNLCWLGYTV